MIREYIPADRNRLLRPLSFLQHFFGFFRRLILFSTILADYLKNICQTFRQTVNKYVKYQSGSIEFRPCLLFTHFIKSAGLRNNGKCFRPVYFYINIITIINQDVTTIILLT